MESSGGNGIENWKRTKVHDEGKVWFSWIDKIVSGVNYSLIDTRFDCLLAVMHG